MIREALLIVTVCGPGTAFADDAPLRIRNLAPASGIYGEPRALGGDVLAAGYEFTFSTELANNFTGNVHGSTLAYFDGETTYFMYGMRGAFAGRWEWGLEAPYVVQQGGYLDSAIDGFHETFGFDDNGRNAVERDQIRYFVADHGTTYVNFSRDRSGWGDVRVTGGYQLVREPARSLALRALVKLPTGDVDQLTGSGAADASVWLDYTDRELLARLHLTMTAALGVMVLGDGNLLPQDQKSAAWYAHVGVGWPLTQAWTLKAQLDYHGALIDAAIDQLGGEALQGSVGARWRFNQKAWTEVAVAEDLIPDSTSDVLVQIRVGLEL